MISITVKGLAKFMTATSSQQRKIVRDFKYPKEDESAAQQKYYKEARSIISAYHRNSHGPAWLLRQVSALQTLASQSTGRTRQRLNHNARAVNSYHGHFADKKFELRDRVTMSVDSANVRIKVTPDLHVIEGQQEKMIKLEFGKKEPDPKTVKIICQVMYQSATHNGAAFPSSAILYYDVPRGAVHKGARAGARMSAEIGAACQTIEDIWQAI